MPVIRKVQSKIPLRSSSKERASSYKKTPENSPKDISANTSRVSEKKDEEVKQDAGYTKKVCYFCKSKTKPVYWDAATLRKSISDRGRIHSRGRLGICAKHQRRVSTEIKRARHLALLPFTVRV